jgi:hypothetical protein
MWQEEASRLEEAALDVLWAQWAAVGASASSGKRPRSVIDPEALVLASLALRARERRLWDQLAWWAAEGSNLLSVQRTRNLLDAYPSPVARALGEFAGLAYEAGDRRWKSFDRHEPAQPARPDKVQSGSARFIEASTMMLRLRLGLGVGVKSDVLAFLISNAGGAFVISDLARAIAYSSRSVHRAAVELADARFIRSFSGHPAEYVVEGKAWLELLEVPTASPPAWRYWQQVFAFVTQLSSFRERMGSSGDSEYVASSYLRELTSQYGKALEWNRLPAPRSDMHPGTSFLEAFGEVARTLAEWMREEI